MMAKKLLIYPFCAELAPIIRGRKLIEYEIGAAVSPKSWGYVGKDCSFCDGGPETGIIVTDDFLAVLEWCDVVFMSFITDRIPRDLYCEKIEQCMLLGKELLITARLQQYLYEEKLNWNKVCVLGCNNEKAWETKKLYPINIPTILVTGVGENCGKMNVQLALRSFFDTKCEHILQYGTKEYSKLFGWETLPSFLLSNGTISDKILSLNHYIYRAVKEEKPELLIIGVPGGINFMTLDDPGDFGEIALCITNAVQADACILCIHNGNYSVEQLGTIERSMSGKLGLGIDCVFQSNQNMYVDPSVFGGKISYLTVDAERYSASPGTYNVFAQEQCTIAFDKIYQSFTGAERLV